MEDLCKKHIKRRTGLIHRDIGIDVYIDACRQPSLLSKSAKSLSARQMIDITADYEEAYDYMESQQLEFSAYTFTTSSDFNPALIAIWLQLPKKMCRHYCERTMRIIEFSTRKQAYTYQTGISVPDRILLERTYSTRHPMDDALVTVVVNPDKSLTEARKECLHAFERLDCSPQNLSFHSDWKIRMRTMLNPNREPAAYQDPFQGILVPSRGFDKFRDEAIARILALKTKSLPGMRPMIISTCVWSYEGTWLNALIEQLGKSGSSCEIICPDEQRVEGLKNRYLNCFNAHTPVGNETSRADYVIFYCAHLITLAEAVSKFSAMANSDANVIMIGDHRMPNIRVRCQAVRDTCGSVMDWFYDPDRYPEYFIDKSPYIVRIPLTFGYDPRIFAIFNEMNYNSQLNNTESNRSDASDHEPPLLFVPIMGSLLNLPACGCSPYNLLEAEACVRRVKQMVHEAGIDARRIGILTTYCEQVRTIKRLLEESKYHDIRVFVGIVEDFVDKVYDYLIITTVETPARVLLGRYPFDDLLHDKRYFNMAITRGVKHITLIGHPQMLDQKVPWKILKERCHVQEEREGSLEAAKGQVHRVSKRIKKKVADWRRIN